VAEFWSAKVSLISCAAIGDKKAVAIAKRPATPIDLIALIFVPPIKVRLEQLNFAASFNRLAGSVNPFFSSEMVFRPDTADQAACKP
jgi:hypothetical protein